jgi:hypothetical protein
MSKKLTKTVETFIGTSYKKEDTISKPVKSSTEILTTKSSQAPKIELPTKPHAPPAKKEKEQKEIPREVEFVEKQEKPRLSPLRTRLKERTEKSAPIIIEEPTQKSKTQSKAKPKKEKESKPVVYKSPTWYKSPRVKLIKPENLVLKELLRKDPRYTEREVERIVSDHT